VQKLTIISKCWIYSCIRYEFS